MNRAERVTRGRNRKIQLRKARKDGFSAAKGQVYLFGGLWFLRRRRTEAAAGA